MNLYDIKLSTYVSDRRNANSSCGGYANYSLEVEAENEEVARYVALQVADIDGDRNAFVKSIVMIEVGI